MIEWQELGTDQKEPYIESKHIFNMQSKLGFDLSLYLISNISLDLIYAYICNLSLDLL